MKYIILFTMLLISCITSESNEYIEKQKDISYFYGTHTNGADTINLSSNDCCINNECKTIDSLKITEWNLKVYCEEDIWFLDRINKTTRLLIFKEIEMFSYIMFKED